MEGQEGGVLLRTETQGERLPAHVGVNAHTSGNIVSLPSKCRSANFAACCCVLEIGTATQWASRLQQMQGLFIALWQNVRFGSSAVQAWHVAFVFSSLLGGLVSILQHSDMGSGFSSASCVTSGRFFTSLVPACHTSTVEAVVPVPSASRGCLEA